MPVEWSSSPPELLLRLDRGAPVLLRDQLESALREAIRSGRLTAGERLPSTRALAAQLGVARGVVTECYAQLSAEGYLRSRRGAATWVAEAGSTLDVAGTARPAREAPPTVDFRPGVPDLGAFPRSDWARAVRVACRDTPDALLGYGGTHGVEELRVVLAGYLGRVRNAHARPEHVVVGAGFAQGLHVVLGVLAARGTTTLAVEDPGDRDAAAVARAVGLRVVPVPVDAEGIDVDALAGTDATVVLVTPAHQSPTGVLLSASRRQQLVAWARSRGGTVLEDDYDAELRYDDQPVGVVQGLAPDRVVLLGSVSKSLAPGVRLGWSLCPPDLAHEVAAAKERADRGSPVLDQLALAHLLRSGQYDRHLRRMRVRYAQRRAVLVDTLRRLCPAAELSGMSAGFHVVVSLPGPRRGLVEEAARRGVGLYDLDRYRHTLPAGGRTQLVLGFGNVRTSAIPDAVAQVADLLA